MARRARTIPSIFTEPGPFRVGDRVRIRRGGEQVEATVVEDRGPLGFKGKRVYGLAFREAEVPDEVYVEREFDEMTLVARAPEPGPKPRKPNRGSE